MINESAHNPCADEEPVGRGLGRQASASPQRGPSPRPSMAAMMVFVLVVACSGEVPEVTTGDAGSVRTAVDTAPTTSATASATTLSTSTTSSPAPDVSTTTLSPVAAIDPLDGLTVRADETVRFATGGTSATFEGAVIRGERDAYRLEASAGQTLEVSISSLEDNAVFDVYGPDGVILEVVATDTVTVLPADGDYLIVVGGTRGNATYTLTISIPA